MREPTRKALLEFPFGVAERSRLSINANSIYGNAIHDEIELERFPRRA